MPHAAYMIPARAVDQATHLEAGFKLNEGENDQKRGWLYWSRARSLSCKYCKENNRRCSIRPLCTSQDDRELIERDPCKLCVINGRPCSLVFGPKGRYFCFQGGKLVERFDKQLRKIANFVEHEDVRAASQAVSPGDGASGSSSQSHASILAERLKALVPRNNELPPRPPADAPVKEKLAWLRAASGNGDEAPVKPKRIRRNKRNVAKRQPVPEGYLPTQIRPAPSEDN